MDQIKKDLFSYAMKGEWEEVVKIYTEHPEFQREQITKSGDTALHLAVSDGQVKIVQQLVGLICQPPNGVAALRLKNEKGNTPLHLAATLGSVKMCKYIAEADCELIGVRNEEEMTPLFLAALSGKKHAFLCLDDLCIKKDPVDRYHYCRGNRGETVLHSAIHGEYFDLAFQIICRYGDLVNCVTEKGLSPLHVLATKPSAFKSGSRLAGFDKIVYYCSFVDELKPDEVREEEEEENKPKLPENYQTCINIFVPLRNAFCVFCE